MNDFAKQKRQRNINKQKARMARMLEDTWQSGYINAKRVYIDKACEWMRKQEGWDALNDKPCPMFSEEDINEFRKAMEGE